MMFNENVTLSATITKTSTGIYSLQFQPTIAGDYVMSIKILDQSESYGYIKNMPQTQVIIPDFISLSHSTYVGSGLVSGRFGFIESFLLTVKDQFDNNYNKQYIYYNGTNNPVYKVDFKANDVDEISILLVNSDSTNGKYTLGYRIVNAYSSLYVRIWLFITSDNGVTYSYQPVLTFPIIVPIVFSPDDLMNEYTNLYQGGIGITEQSNTNITNSVIAGAGLTKFMEFYPQNAYNLTYLHDENRDYLFIDFYIDIADECLCQRLEDFNKQKFAMIYTNKTSLSYTLKNCYFLDYSPNACYLYGLWEWKLQSTQNKNYNDGNCLPRIWENWPEININQYEKLRNEATKVINGYVYDISASFTKSGIYKVYTSVITMGQLKVVAYKTPDFKYEAFEQFINWVDIGMNGTFNSFFSTKTLSYSMKISGLLTWLTSDTYKITLVTNKKAQLYFNGIKVIDKTSDTTSGMFIKDLFNDVFYYFEIKIIVDEITPEPDGSLPYLKLRWSSQNMIDMDIKPRNFYYINPLLENGSKTLTVQAGTSNAMNSVVDDTTSNILGTEYDETRRLTYKIIQNTQPITGSVTIRDIYSKLNKAPI